MVYKTRAMLILVPKMGKVDGVQLGVVGVLVTGLQLAKAVAMHNQVRSHVSFAVDDGVFPISAIRMVSLLRFPGMIKYCFQT